MKNFALLIALLSSCAFTFAFASENTNSIDLKSDSSASNRQNKKLEVTAFGSSTGFAPVSGLSLGKYVNSSLVVQLDIGSGHKQAKGDMFGFSNQIEDSSASQVDVTVKKFIGNSFYLKSGLGHRSVSQKFQYGNSFLGFGDPKGPRSHYEYSGQVTAAIFGIGNQWQWDNFTIGGDWAAGWLPFSSQVQTENYADVIGNPDAYVLEDMRASQKKSITTASITVSLYLGASF